MKTLIQIQQEYIDTLNAGIARWSHRPQHGLGVLGSGHAGRIARGARRKAEKDLRRIGYTDQHTIDQLIKDARDVAELERNSDV